MNENWDALAQLLEMYDTWLMRKFYTPVQYENERERIPPMRGAIDPGRKIQDHVRWLAYETALASRAVLPAGGITWPVAVHRLGQIQMALWVWGHFSIEELREHLGDDLGLALGMTFGTW